MRQQIIKSIKTRLKDEIAPQSPLKYLFQLEPETYMDTVISIVYLYTRAKRGANKNTVYLTEVISAIGHGIRNKFKLKRDSALAAKTGAFMLYSFEQLSILQVVLGQSANGHNSYIIQVLDDDAISSLWETLKADEVEKLPSETPYAPWITTRHNTGANMVKTGNKDVLDKITPDSHPIVFDCINKAQEMGWRVNKDVYDLHLWALRNKTDAFAEIWEQQNPEAKTTKLREAKAIGGIAKRFLTKTFYHLYYYDFRGRKYPATAYLHEQGSDLARGLLLRADKKSIGKEGFFWLLVSVASNWAGDAGRDDGAKTDKIPLKDRYLWVLDNEEIILSYAENPKVNQGWMKADKPWQFLAACFELKKFRNWQMSFFDDYVDTKEIETKLEEIGVEPYDYESHLECYIDGSNNGSQHLSALTKDEITAPHVNLVPLNLPGDLYKYVGDHVWEHLHKVVEGYTKHQIKACETFIDNLIELKKQIHTSEPRSDRRKQLVDDVRKFKETYADIANVAAPIYWLRVKDAKHKRKVVKRNVMTLPYGGTAYGLGQQQIDDAKKHGIDLLLHMEHKWGAYLGREVFEDCRVSLERPMRLLSVFEQAGKKAEEEGRFLSWNVPVTNFPVVQNYTEGKVKKIWVQYGPPLIKKSTGYYENTLQLSICFIEDVIPSKGKQSQGASPNAIHSLDAAHLALTVHRAQFPITTIHDSFGCLLADMPKLFTLIRETFVELYMSNPLESLMNDINGDI
ncbi:DNA-directed RNA polymerase, partial [Flavobacterium sp.]|uniref:DNA-directed RNA polymerase n=1 Tax=Flavobacterium sp. TaxID=239 RepID=UPI0037BEB683